MTIITNIGKITASKETLDAICGAFFKAWHNLQEHDAPNCLRRDAVTTACEIFDALQATGYFKPDHK